MEPKTHSFQTNAGYCYIYPDRIELSRESPSDGMTGLGLGKNSTWLLVSYILLAFVLFYLAFEAYRSRKPGLIILPVFGGIYLLISVIRSVKKSATLVIDRERIRSIEIRNDSPGRKPCLMVSFADESGKQKKKRIRFPGSSKEGAEERDRAAELLRAEKLI